ncbi:XopAW family type III secretion system calcium-binding effector [Pseudomonas sp. NFACC39-1]|uniref:XopAW family type III secretion system calcium-binding effector n=1 Tax=Pseudomonas sp. NFACC39-1 TaxID=1566195 RepID=UPI0008B32FDA|nr:XopAW family type III secretion system calcium-binding effector [Pseudomonas sp. NFACC39-1]SEO73898.1 EF hand [Pseudomonas sp. NFACC39-1]
MIGSVSSYSPYTSTSSTTTSSARSQQFQKELLSKLDSNADGSIDQDELSTALSQKSDDGILVSLSDNFSDLDSDSSGDLSSDELAAMAPPPQQASGEALLSLLDADAQNSLDTREQTSALQANRNSDSSTEQPHVSEALNRMIANLSRQYSLDDVVPVGKYLNVAT